MIAGNSNIERCYIILSAIHKKKQAKQTAKQGQEILGKKSQTKNTNIACL